MNFDGGLSVVSDGFYNQYDMAFGCEQTDKNEQEKVSVNWSSLAREKFIVYDEFDRRLSNDPRSNYFGLYIDGTYGLMIGRGQIG